MCMWMYQQNKTIEIYVWSLTMISTNIQIKKEIHTVVLVITLLSLISITVRYNFSGYIYQCLLYLTGFILFYYLDFCYEILFYCLTACSNYLWHAIDLLFSYIRCIPSMSEFGSIWKQEPDLLKHETKGSIIVLETLAKKQMLYNT